MKTDTLFAFIGGAIVGAAAALLFAPESGEETRKKIKESVDNEYQSLKKKYEEYKGKCSRADKEVCVDKENA